MEVAVVGGGAAGFFAAINVKENYPGAHVVILEKSKSVLSKVKISGGGRCNVTNGSTSIKQLCQAYPRGGKALKKAFRVFNTKHAMQWFESRGVPLVIQDDLCVFPVSQDSQSIIDCFLTQAKKLNIEIKPSTGVVAINPAGNRWALEFTGTSGAPIQYDRVIITTGGSPKRKSLEWLEALGHKIEDPVPSLFTFNMPNEPITELMGIVVETAVVAIQGTKIKSDGPLLITHWGMSGPAILKLSAFGARVLSERHYEFNIQVNWIGMKNQEVVKTDINNIINAHPNKLLQNIKPYSLPDRLWRFLLEKSHFPADKKWSELGYKGLNKMVDILSNDIYCVKGKTTFKEEFVTCGGVSLDSVDIDTMQSKVCKNLYFAGEVLDMDGITGGFNFQAAWTTAFIAAKLNQ